MLTSASVMALASFGLVLVAVRIFALFAQWCSRACAGESCIVTLVFWRMQAHSECEVVRLRASPAKRGVQSWLRCHTRHVCEHVPQASVCKWRAGEHPWGAGWASLMAWCVAWLLWPGCKRSLRFSCCMLSHNRVRAQVNVELWRFISMGLCSQPFSCTCAMVVTMSEAGVAAVCERVRTGHRGLQFVCGATTVV